MVEGERYSVRRPPKNAEGRCECGSRGPAGGGQDQLAPVGRRVRSQAAAFDQRGFDVAGIVEIVIGCSKATRRPTLRARSEKEGIQGGRRGSRGCKKVAEASHRARAKATLFLYIKG